MRSWRRRGLPPQSSHEEVLDIALQLQAEGKMTPEIRLAWDEIRTIDKRLAIDFFLYNPTLVDPDQFG